MGLRQVTYSDMRFMNRHSRNDKPKSTNGYAFNIFHQNIRGLKHKYNELLCHLEDHVPHVLCFTEHHLDCDEIPHIHIDNYTLGAFYCRRHFKMGGTCIYVHNNQSAINIDLDKFCNDKDIEACAVSVNKANFEICILTIYRSPSGNYDKFLDKLELILLKFSKKKRLK
jgi:hypothetical protein